MWCELGGRAPWDKVPDAAQRIVLWVSPGPDLTGRRRARVVCQSSCRPAWQPSSGGQGGDDQNGGGVGPLPAKPAFRPAPAGMRPQDAPSAESATGNSRAAVVMAPGAGFAGPGGEIGRAHV